MPPNRSKLAELILHIVDRHAMDEPFESSRLAWALFHADFLHYARNGLSITGARYIRQRNAPVPEALNATLEELRRGDALVVRERFAKGKRLLAARPADLTVFTADELSTVDDVLAQLAARTPGDLANRFRAWELAEDGEEIPYHTALLSARSPSAEDFAFARELAASVHRVTGDAA